MPDRPEPLPQVFVIMPFLDGLEDVYTDLIRQPLEDVGFEVKRADTLLNQRNILQDVVRGIADATLIVADVTGLNANVLYELGLAHALGKRTVMLTQRIEELPFDLRPYRANEYSTNFKRAGDLAKLMADLGRAVLSGEADFSNPVQDYAPEAFETTAQVSLVPTRDRARRPSGSSGSRPSSPSADSEEEDAEPGLFDHIVRMQTANERVDDIANEMTKLTEDVGNAIEGQGARLERATETLGDRAAAAVLMIARDAAKDLNVFADAMEPQVADLREALQEMTISANAIARSRTIDTQEESEALQEEIDSLQGIEASLTEASQSVGEFAGVLTDLPNMERNLTVAARRAARVITETAETMSSGEAEFARARGLLEERLREFRARSARS